MTRPDVIIAGAGMAGLAAAARVREKGGRVIVLEKGDRPGGSMLLSSGVIWRHRDFRQFKAECPGGHEKLQRLVHERLDPHIEWLRELGVRVLAPDTGNPATVGVRFDTVSLTKALALRAGNDLRLGQPLRDIPGDVPVILATGGFPASREPGAQIGGADPGGHLDAAARLVPRGELGRPATAGLGRRLDSKSAVGPGEA